MSNFITNPYKRKRIDPNINNQKNEFIQNDNEYKNVVSQHYRTNSTPKNDEYTESTALKGKSNNVKSTLYSNLFESDHNVNNSSLGNKKLSNNISSPSNNTDNNKNLSNSSSSASALVISASNKAGMDGIDRETIDKIILEESGNSLFMQQQKRRDEKVNQKIQLLYNKLRQQEKKDYNWKKTLECSIDRNEIPTLLESRPIRSCKVVVDMDMFYMACELLSRPELAAINDTQPACVGGIRMLSTSNYAARKYGVRAGMPGYIAQKLVQKISNGKQNLIFCNSNYQLYNEKSKEVMNVLKEYDPYYMRSYSLDEAYIDLGPYLACKLTLIDNKQNSSHEDIMLALQQSESKIETQISDSKVDCDSNEFKSKILQDLKHPLIDWSNKEIVDEILLSYSPKKCLDVATVILTGMREHVLKVSGLSCSAGLAANFLLAKIASDCNKPNGQKVIDSSHESIIEFLYPLSIRKICGVGRVTEKILKAFEISTVQDLHNERALVRFLFQTNGTKDSQAAFLLKASVGCSSSDGKETDEGDSSNDDVHQKGISRERSFLPEKSWSILCTKLDDIGRGLSDDMKRKNLFAHTISVKVKLNTFDCLSRSRTMSNGVYLQTPAEDLVHVAIEILHEIKKEYVQQEKQNKNVPGIDIPFSVRLLGIRCTNFRDDEDTHMSNSKQKTINQYLVNVADAFLTRKTNSSIKLKSTDFSMKHNQVEGIYTDNETSAVVESNVVFKATTSKSSIVPPITVGQTPASNEVKKRGVHGFSLSPRNESKNVKSAHKIPPYQCPESSDEISDARTSQIKCPVCNVFITVPVNDNQAINNHIDSCLNGFAIRQVVREDAIKNNKRQNVKRHRSLNDFFCGT